MDDRGGARLLHRFPAGLGIQAAGLSITTPNTPILRVSRVTTTAVSATHRAVIQSH